MSTVPWGRVNQSADELTFTGSSAPIFVLGGICIAVALVGYAEYSFYQTALLKVLVDSLRVSASVLQSIAISFLGFFFLIGVLLIVFNSKTTLVISKRKGQVLLQTKRIFGGKTEKLSDVDDIARVELRKEIKMEKVPFGRGRPGQISAGGALFAQALAQPEPVTYQESVVVFRDRKELLLGRMRSLNGTGNLGPILLDSTGTPLAAKQVASFVGVPFAEADSGAPNDNQPSKSGI